MASYTHKRIGDVEDAAAKFGSGDRQETRFANDDLETEQTGLSHHRLKPGSAKGFGHRHDEAEEVYFVVSGSGRVKLDEKIAELAERDLIRVSAASPGRSRRETTASRSWRSGRAVRTTVARSCPTGETTETSEARPLRGRLSRRLRRALRGSPSPAPRRSACRAPCSGSPRSRAASASGA